jgi:hypothetical protein
VNGNYYWLAITCSNCSVGIDSAQGVVVTSNITSLPVSIIPYYFNPSGAKFTVYGNTCPAPTSPTQTFTVTYSPTFTNTRTITYTPTLTFTPTITFTPTDTPTQTPTPTITDTPTITYTPTITSTPTSTFTSTNSPTATLTNTFTDTPTITYTYTPTQTPTNTATPTVTDTPLPNYDAFVTIGSGTLSSPIGLNFLTSGNLWVIN